MVNKALRLVLYSIFTISLLIVVPFNNINAETVAGDSPIIGVNIKYRDYDIDHEPYQLSASLEMPHRWQCVSSHSTMGCQVWSSQDTSGTIQDEITGYINVSNGSYTDILYEYEFVLDKSYVGYVDFSSAIGVTAYSRYYVNGTSFTVTSKQLITSFTVSRYQLEYAPLEVLDKVRQWNIPFESIPALMYSMTNYDPIDMFNYEYMNYPVYQSNVSSPIFQSLIDTNYDVVVIVMMNRNVWNGTRLLNFVDLNYIGTSSTFTISAFEQLNIISTGSANYTLMKFSIRSSGSTTLSIDAKEAFNYIPIFIGRSNNLKISTDFAIRFGLTNQLLEDIHLIAQGTQQSQSSSGSLDQTTSQFSSDANDLVTIEETFNSSMNQSLQNVNPTFNMGSSFLASANWVSTQFNRIVNNTPFASLITFGLTLGLGLLIIGKVRK